MPKDSNDHITMFHRFVTEWRKKQLLLSQRGNANQIPTMYIL